MLRRDFKAMPPFDATKPIAPLRIGVVGVGQRGRAYAQALADGEVPGAMLGGVCDVKREALAPFRQHPCFEDVRLLVQDAALDAVVIATPHPEHQEPTIVSLSAGLHVLTEKPLAVHVADVERMLAVHERRAQSSQVFATALVLRADVRYEKLRALLAERALGRIQRIAWTVTDCLRSEAYYASADWRGTFAGEGGGLLVNQCSHQLDLWQWLFGMPERVRAFVGLGRYHAIEVEDQVTAYLEYANGTTGVFVASTGEAPGTNRLEVAGELGRVVVEGPSFETWRNAVSTREQVSSGDVRSPAAPAEYEKLTLPVGGVGPRGLLRNFASAISGEGELLAPARDGLRSIELANALLASGIGARTVELALGSERHPRISDSVRPS
jgi:predicted dehydrogenase